MSNRVFVAGASLVLGLAIAAPASAQEGSKKKDDSYGYIFKDDPLQAEGIGAHTAQIRVHKAGRRDLLLRPRVHFVQEMLKSVENM